ncbi:unnamed protein product [Lepeophtheirus salmonis]|uniref:(salmon louse) hypothetical protein n=1 Tax=Lepeophtheirus salmonis TaxID=72036 RepID=A0A7R8H6E7_LEPSM|nr:unnamed protein product [Lepeophtheirus salmonis]CAF2898200.1 unnamed protein product [Lepeophtheirus salmonis]
MVLCTSKIGLCAHSAEKMLCAELVLLRGTSKQNTTNCKDLTERAEAVKRVVARFGKQSISFKVFVNSRCNFIEATYNLDSFVTKHWKPFTDGEYIKEVFLSCA